MSSQFTYEPSKKMQHVLRLMRFTEQVIDAIHNTEIFNVVQCS